jgi:molybdopterin/thiamine biosynthesis adenylyltransferase
MQERINIFLKGNPMEIYDRQIRVFGEEDQRILQKLTVGIVRAGGIGSLLFLFLVFLGVKCIIVINPDSSS